MPSIEDHQAAWRRRGYNQLAFEECAVISSDTERSRPVPTNVRPVHRTVKPLPPPPPMGPERVVLSLRMEPELHNRVRVAAEREDRTVTTWILRAIKAALRAEGA
jgi:hypothetical protein